MDHILYQSHAGSWAITILLFFVSFVLLKMGKPTGKKITHMILRLFFVIMVVSGLGMLFTRGFPLIFVIKGILAIWLIAVMERLLSKSATKSEQGASMKGSWIQFIIAFVLVALIGFNVIQF